MQFSTIFLAALASTSAVFAAHTKANEYGSTDCSGKLLWGHNPGCGCVDIDVTTHSVYLANGPDNIHGFSEHGCGGIAFGAVSDKPPCFNPATFGNAGGKKVQSLYFTGTGCKIADWLKHNAAKIVLNVATKIIRDEDSGNLTAIAFEA